VPSITVLYIADIYSFFIFFEIESLLN